ncbi:MAG: thioredoxin family protein [Chitinophagales bacterium]|nr:thioredoxin family protein [Chitinophagales bacterium]
MKKNLLPFYVLVIVLVSQFSAQAQSEGVKWMSITEAEKLNASHPKKILIDIYTDWCGWCKKLDATTYKDPRIVKYLNDNFYAVKLNAESKETITFQNKDYAYDPARRINAVAANFLSSSGGYPTTTFLDEKLQVISIVPGYMQSDMMNNVLSFFAENHYLNTDWNTYLSSLNTSAK